MNTTSALSDAAAALPVTPSVKRRLAAMLYESLLLFGVVFVTGFAFDTLTGSRHALTLRSARQAILFLAIGVYFIFFWCRSGQTLAMKTWRIRLVAANGQRLRLQSAAVRYVLAWMWILPAMAIDSLFGLKGWASIGVIVVGMVAWLSTVLSNPERQFLHDRLAGTRLVDAPRLPQAS